MSANHLNTVCRPSCLGPLVQHRCLELPVATCKECPICLCDMWGAAEGAAELKRELDSERSLLNELASASSSNVPVEPGARYFGVPRRYEAYRMTDRWLNAH